MFSKYLDQMNAIREKTVILLDDLRNYQDGHRYKSEFASLICDFNNVNTCLNTELRIYDQEMPYLNYNMLIYYLRHNDLDVATNMVNQWYDYVHDLIAYYTSLDCSKAVLYLECALTVYNNSLNILLAIRIFNESKKLKKVA